MTDVGKERHRGRLPLGVQVGVGGTHVVEFDEYPGSCRNGPVGLISSRSVLSPRNGERGRSSVEK